MARSKPPPHVQNPFYHPKPDEYDFNKLLETLRDCRVMAKRLTMTCGLRNPIYREAECLLAQVDAVAALSRVTGATDFVDAKRYVSARQSLMDADLIRYDDANHVVLIERWFKHNPPMNPSHVKGIETALKQCPSKDLRERCHKALSTAWEEKCISKSNNKPANQSLPPMRPGERLATTLGK